MLNAGVMAGTLTLTGTLVVANGGTGGVTAAAARANLSAAVLGANTDITSLITSTALVESGTINGGTLGYRGIPTKQTGGGLTLALTNAGGRIRLTTGGLTIPANGSIAFPVDTAIRVINRSGAPQTIAITTDTLIWSGSGVTGTRTMADKSQALLEKDTATEWMISGDGLT